MSSRSRFMFAHDLRANAARLSRGKPLHTSPDPDLVEPALVAQADHLIDELLLLLVVEARIERLGRIGHVTLVLRAIVQELRLVAHLLDDVVRRITLGTRDTQVEPVGAVMTEI